MTKELEELEKVSKEYEDILKAINREFRRELRKVGVRKNVIPVKYILPKVYISRLLKYRPFRQAWERKTRWYYFIPETEKGKEKKGWIRIQLEPNIGGVPVEEGPELKVCLVRIPRRKRKRKKDGPGKSIKEKEEQLSPKTQEALKD